jgi:hypothetical protein
MPERGYLKNQTIKKAKAIISENFDIYIEI